MAVTLPTGLGPVAGGIMTIRPDEGFEVEMRAGLIAGDAPLAGLRGNGRWGGKGDGLEFGSDARGGRGVGLRGRGFLGGLSLCSTGGDMAGAAGGFPAGKGGRAALLPPLPAWADGAGLRGLTMLTG